MNGNIKNLNKKSTFGIEVLHPQLTEVVVWDTVRESLRKGQIWMNHGVIDEHDEIKV